MILANFLIPIILGGSPGTEVEKPKPAGRVDFTDKTIELKEEHKGEGKPKSPLPALSIKEFPVQGFVGVRNDQLVIQGSIEPEDKSQRVTGFASRIKHNQTGPLYRGNGGVDYTNNDWGLSVGHAVTFEELSLTKAQDMFTYVIKDFNKFRAGLSYFTETAGAKRGGNMSMESAPNALNVFLGAQLEKDLGLMISFDNNQNAGISVGKSTIPPEFLTCDPYTRMAMLTSTNANGMNYAGAITGGKLDNELEKIAGITYNIGAYFGMGKLNVGGGIEIIDYNKIPVVLLPDGKSIELPAVDFTKQSFRADAVLRLIQGLYAGANISSSKINGGNNSTQIGVGVAYRLR